MKDIKRQKMGAGFTLLELMIAIFIFVIVLAAVYGAYVMTTKAIDTAETQADINTKARIAMHRITTDLKGFYIGEGGVLEGKRGQESENRADSLNFTSTAHLTFSDKELPAGLALIRYSTSLDPESGDLQLFRLDVPYRPGYLEKDYSGQKGDLLCDGLRWVQFSYFDRTGNEMDRWQTDETVDKPGEDNKRIPALIEVVLHFAGKDRNDLIFKTAVAIPPLKELKNR